MDHLLPWLRLQLTPGLGRIGLIRLITHYKSPEEALAASAHGWPKLPGLRAGLARLVPAVSEPKVAEALHKITGMNGWLRTIWDPGYPQLLKQLPDPPAVLYGCGELPRATALAVVGSRNPTIVGQRFTEQLCKELAAAGVVIVSGLARGIDTAAHHGALIGGGKTVAVLGCGIDRVYPAENKELFRQVTEHGAVVTEYPPGTEPLPGHFPGRNRIISGLSRATLVVEAARDSGSLITAEFALEQGREVLAVPGGIDRNTSYGPNQLIKQGAHPVTEAAEILQLLGLDSGGGRPLPNREETTTTLPGPCEQILALLDLTPRHCDELAGQSGLTAMDLSAILLQLELLGYAEKLPGGRYVRGRRAH